MQVKTKSALLLGIVLFIGIVIGSLLNSWIVDNRIDEIREDLLAGKFLIKEIEKSVDLNDIQKEQVEQMLQEYRPKFIKLAINSRLQMFSLIDTLAGDLKTVLSEEQVNDLREGILRDRPLLRERIKP